jgi:LETM1 and EF-hand domain-containing protein 1
LNEAELEVDSEKASYKQKLEVLQQQQELIEDEQEQEQKEEDARRAKREADEQEARTAESLLPDSEVILSPTFSHKHDNSTLHGSYCQKRWKRRMLV